jgi:hypothetical protein
MWLFSETPSPRGGDFDSDWAPEALPGGAEIFDIREIVPTRVRLLPDWSFQRARVYGDLDGWAGLAREPDGDGEFASGLNAASQVLARLGPEIPLERLRNEMGPFEGAGDTASTLAALLDLHGLNVALRIGEDVDQLALQVQLG